MDYSCYISFDLTGCSDNSSWTVTTATPSEGNWKVNPTSPLAAGQSYGESVATGTTNPGTAFNAQLADLTGFVGSDGSLTIAGPLQSNNQPVSFTCSFQCPTGLDPNQVSVQVNNDINNTYSITYYTCSSTPSSSNKYVHGTENSDHPLYIIFAIST